MQTTRSWPNMHWNFSPSTYISQYPFAYFLPDYIPSYFYSNYVTGSY